MLCGDKEETINHIMSVCSKLTKKQYNPKHDLVEKVIHWVFGKKLKFNHTAKWYTHKSESIFETAEYNAFDNNGSKLESL